MPSAQKPCATLTSGEEADHPSVAGRGMHQEMLTGSGYGDITTEIAPVDTFRGRPSIYRCPARLRDDRGGQRVPGRDRCNIPDMVASQPFEAATSRIMRRSWRAATAQHAGTGRSTRLCRPAWPLTAVSLSIASSTRGNPCPRRALASHEGRLGPATHFRSRLCLRLPRRARCASSPNVEPFLAVCSIARIATSRGRCAKPS